MKEYIEPIVEVIELPENDIIMTSNPGGTGEGIETKPEELLGAPARNGMQFD